MASILIVDDVPMNIKLLGELLRDRYEIIFANNGRKAVELAQERKPDLILMDVIMPEMDGLTACQLMKSQASTADIPIIFITARSQGDDIIHGFEAGGQDYIAKPFNTQELYARVQSHIELKKSREAAAAYAAQLEKKNQELSSLLEKLEIMATIDPLTNIANRRYAITRMREEVSRHRRTGCVFSLLMVDIDGFKGINDNYGHEIGDHILKHVVQVITSNLRKQDMVARWGGEEFLIMLPETNGSAAEFAAKKVRKKVEDSVFTLQDLTIPVTVTIGVCQYDISLDLDANIRRSDEAMY